VTLSHKLYITTSHSNREGKVSPRKKKRTTGPAALSGVPLETTSIARVTSTEASAPQTLKVLPLPLTKTITVVVGLGPQRAADTDIKAREGRETTREDGGQAGRIGTEGRTVTTGLGEVPIGRAGDIIGGLTLPHPLPHLQVNPAEAGLPRLVPLRREVVGVGVPATTGAQIISLLLIGTTEIGSGAVTKTEDGDPCLTAKCTPTFKSELRWSTRSLTAAREVSDFTTASSGRSAPPNKYRKRIRTCRISIRARPRLQLRPSLARTWPKRRSDWLPLKR
jgi:hypothetical protein